MDDMIYRQAAIEAFDGVKVDKKYCTEYDNGYNDGIDFAVSRLSVLPPAQFEIIRCKDCEWCKDADGPICKNPASWVVVTDYDFGCVCAERRTDG